MENFYESPTYVLAFKLSYMCCVYNAALNGSLDNDSFQGTNGQIYQWYYKSQTCWWVNTNVLNYM